MCFSIASLYNYKNEDLIADRLLRFFILLKNLTQEFKILSTVLTLHPLINASNLLLNKTILSSYASTLYLRSARFRLSVETEFDLFSFKLDDD